MRLAARIGLALVGLVFLVSALVKAWDLHVFATQIAYYKLIADPAAILWTAGAIVVVEALLGGLLLAGLYLRGWSLGATAAMLVALTAVFAWGWLARGIEDCGCFGSYMQLSPAVSIAKNFVMLAILGLCWAARPWRAWSEPVPGAPHYLSPEPRPMGPPLAVLGVTLAATGVLMALGVRREAQIQAASGLTFDAASAPVGVASGSEPPLTTTETLATVGAAAPLPTPEAAPADASPFAAMRFETPDGESGNLAQGDWFVAMLSATCDECKASVPLVNDLPLAYGDVFPPIVGFMLGSPADLEAFRAETQPAFPTISMPSIRFMSLIGDDPPRFYYLREGRVMGQWDYQPPPQEELTDLVYAAPFAD